MTPQVYELSVRGTAQYSPTLNLFPRENVNPHPGAPLTHRAPARSPAMTFPISIRVSPARAFP
eukprot:31242-Pelagococcus_subviridis.AAC.7